MSRRLLSLAAGAAVAAALRLSPSGVYHWPSSRGSMELYGSSSLTGPKLGLSEDITALPSFMWNWSHPQGPFHCAPYGVAVDDKKDIFLTTDVSLFKIAPNGTTLWNWVPMNHATHIAAAAALSDGLVHVTTTNGRIWGLSMETGEEQWSAKFSHVTSKAHHGTVTAKDGIVVAAFNSTEGNDTVGNGFVAGYWGRRGLPIWVAKPDSPVTSFMACYPGDGTVLYQDSTGRAYSHNLYTGVKRWAAGGVPNSMTMGSATTANGILYTVAANNTLPPPLGEEPQEGLVAGFLTARNVTDGAMLWTVGLPLPPHNAPVVGRLPGRAGQSVVLPCGFPLQNGSTAVYAFDALTGEKQWTFRGPTLTEKYQAGVEVAMLERFLAWSLAWEFISHPWSAPMMDGAGTVYVGNQNGQLYRLRDENLDGAVDGPGEVGSVQTNTTAFGTSSPAILPGMFLYANTHALIALKTPGGEPEPLPLA